MKKLIGLLMLSMILALAACGSDTADTPKDTGDAKPEAKKDEIAENLKIGDSATIDDITITINKVTVTDERNEFDEVKADRAIIIDYTVENNSDEDYPVGMDLSFFVDGKKVDTLAIGDVTMDSISSGRTIDGQTAYPADGEKLELEFQPMTHFGNEKYVFDIEL